MFACVVFFLKKKTLRQCLKSTAEKDLNAVKEWMTNQLNNKKTLKQKWNFNYAWSTKCTQESVAQKFREKNIFHEHIKNAR